MNYTVYTDGAFSENKKISGCSYLIITDKNYISSDSVKLTSVASATHAETISVGLAAEYLLNNVKLSGEDTVEFNIDCASTINFYNKHLKNKNKVRSNSSSVVRSVVTTRALSNKCKVVFTKVSGHKDKINPNTVVDRLAKIAIRRE